MLVGATSGSVVTALTVDVVAEMSVAPTLKYMESVEQPVVHTKPSATLRDREKDYGFESDFIIIEWERRR